MADWDADSFEPDEPIKKAAGQDKWEGEDEEEDVKDNWDDEDEEEEKKTEVKKIETKVSEKKKLSEKIKEKENRLKKKQQEVKEKELEDKEEELTPEQELEEKLRVQKLQEAADLELAKDAFGVTTVTGIDAMCPSSKEDFTEFEKLLKEKICQYEKSVHYSSFLDSLFRELCISLEVDDLKKVSNSLSILLSEKQKQEKQNKGKKKKKGVVAGGGLKAQLRDDLDYAEFDGGYAQDYEDFM
ncbi:eukaryotic translation initiation factor 3 subunit J-B [Cynoglossus semilaevis]|uniref:Eukaryotic translation initiation factor 3 subunit J n=1 Tax=Cynoglossus semilaevis TaxID=244447 RepID=A0A3P8UNA2_CYNSE|nr:eukaryotic translation initiation factor 3 subunit J [Cynoglossus semilaevis]